MITLFYIGLFVCCFLCLYRIGRGPSAPDRTVAIDILGIVIVGFCAMGFAPSFRCRQGRTFT